ncbi:MAG: hypothetical protein ACE5JR_09060 [Gemmatimonadota bacterium]
MNRVTYLVAALGMALAGCGDSATGPAVNRNDPGSGTRTMKVTADIEGKDVPGGFVTDFDVSLRNVQGTPISGATVTVRNSNLGTVNLLEIDAGSGDYEATVNTFAPGDYRLDVVKGTDNVQGVVVGGMAAHSILSPPTNSTVLSTQPLTVTWSRPSEAAAADVETKDFAVEGIPDSGSFTISVADNPPRDDQRIRVWRFNEVQMVGGLFGSRLKLKIRNTVEPVVVQ